jgi:hypothetical protein
VSGRLVRGAVIGLAVVALVVVALVAVGHQGSSRRAPDASSPLAGTAGAPGPALSSGLLVPRSGAYLGAYVEPAIFTQASQISAVREFQKQVGHSIDLVHTYHPWGTKFPSLADRYFADSGKVLLLTWGGDPNTKAIIAGRDDAMIRARAEAVKRLGHPILLEFRHEMDRPNLQWTIHGPADYIAAWDHVRQIFAEAGATNVSWVWCPTGYGFQDGRAAAFYPGNDEVNWVCADVYSFSAQQSLRAAAAPFLSWARHTGKPILIGEFASDGNAASWASYLSQAGQLAQSDPQIKGMAYFDGDGTDSQGRPFQYSLSHDPPALAAYGRLLSSQFFRPAVRNDP